MPFSAATETPDDGDYTAVRAELQQVFDAREAAEYTRIEWSTLKKWRTVGGGPAYVRAGTKVLYLREDLDAFLQANRVA